MWPLRFRRSEHASPTPKLQPHASTGRNKFLIISNYRCGSTWLETALGSLPDVATDYEFKWEISYRPLKMHRSISDRSPMVSEILDSIDRDMPVVGSKLVFDPIAYSQDQIERMHARIGAEVQIIHLVRRYRDIVISRQRGMLHRLRQERAALVGRHLRAELERISRGQTRRPRDPVRVKVADVHAEVRNLFLNDLHVERTLSNRNHLRIEYETIGDDFEDAASFIGSRATPEELQRALRDSPTEKLPKAPAESIIENLADLETVFEYFEAMANHRRIVRRIATRTRSGEPGDFWLPPGGPPPRAAAVAHATGS
ncbi:MAG: hypothetical protein ABR970_06800 [Roseiarcus sp.]|jgi:hypothetical protein